MLCEGRCPDVIFQGHGLVKPILTYVEDDGDRIKNWNARAERDNDKEEWKVCAVNEAAVHLSSCVETVEVILGYLFGVDDKAGRPIFMIFFFY